MMTRIYARDYRLLVGLTLVLLAAFLYTGISAYLFSYEMLAHQSQSLDSETIFARIHAARIQLIIHLAIGGCTTLLVLGLAVWGANRFRGQYARLAAIDPLTGLANRQSFEILLEQSVRDMQRAAHPLSVIQFEIDALKPVIDTDGHLSGEHVLYSIAQLANGLIRGNDIIARWSSTAFIILLRNCPLEVAVRTAEALRNAVAQHPFGVSRDITVCIGVAACGFEELSVNLLLRADQALRGARANGPAQMVVSHSPA